MFAISNSTLRFNIAALLIAALLTLSLAVPQPARAATLVVDTLMDGNDHSCTDGDCSLREAIEVAAAGDTITFSVSGTIVLIRGELSINKDLTISGPGPDNLTVSGHDSSRVFYIAGGNVAISGLTIADGYATDNGGGMYNGSASPTLTNVTFSGNSASGYYGVGGGMYNDSGSPALTNVTFSGNTASWGGGIYNISGSPTLTNVTFSGNFAGDYASGGGMVNYYGSPTLTDVTFSSNSADNGGGIYNWYGNPTLTNVTFSGNTAVRGRGGGILNEGGSPTLTNVTFSDNLAGDYGGGMSNEYGSPTLTDVTFSGNSSSYQGGGMYNISGSPTLTEVTFSGNSGGYGGGMYNWGNPILTNVTFSGNSVYYNGGGMYNYRDSNPTLTNATFSGNSAGDYGGGMYNNDSDPILTNVTLSDNSANYGNGGGMYNYSSSPTLTNVTFSSNSASYHYGGGMYNQDHSSPILTNVTFSGNSAYYEGGGIFSDDTSHPLLKNAILAGNAAPTAPDCSGEVTSYGYNLIQDVNGCVIIGDETGNLYGVDARLGPLQDNGGDTPTHALLHDSPAINAASCTDPFENPVTHDQRDVTRPQGPACDMGAYEADAMHVQGIALRLRGSRLIGTVTVYDQAGLPVESASVTVEVSGPIPPRSFTGVTDANGRARFTGPARSGTWQLCVTDIVKDGSIYDATQNVETCDTITVP